MKEYKCVMTRGDHKVGYPAEINGVTSVIEEYEKDGWHLYTYHVTCLSAAHPVYQMGFYHHFLFEKEKTA